MADELAALLAMMTSEERAQYETVQRAAAADLLTAAERANIGQRPAAATWPAFVNELRARLVANRRVGQRPQ